MGSCSLKWCKLGVKAPDLSPEIPENNCAARGLLIQRFHRGEKDAFSGYLRRKGLVLTATIPIELYEDDGLRIEGNYFVFE